MQILPAIAIASSAIRFAESFVFRISAVAADTANGPPDPIAAPPSSGSITSPLPLTRYVSFVSATSSSASRCRSTRSVRHSFANSTTERGKLPLNCSNFASKRAKSANASAVEPANPARILSLYSRRSFRADPLSTSCPSVTCPSPAITTLLSRRTHITVVDLIFCFISMSGLFYRAFDVPTPHHRETAECGRLALAHDDQDDIERRPGKVRKREVLVDLRHG